MSEFDPLAAAEYLARTDPEIRQWLRDEEQLMGLEIPDSIKLSSGSYRIIAALGDFGQGSVFHARVEDGINRGANAFLKIPRLVTDLTPELLSDARTVFRAEHDAYKTVINSTKHFEEHERHAPLWVDYGECTLNGDIRDLPVLACEYIDGPTLNDWVYEKPTPSIDEFLDIARQLAYGLLDVHRTGYMHGDLNPKNIIVGENSNGSPRVVLVDFGFSCDLRGRLWKRDRVGGHAGFIAPELYEYATNPDAPIHPPDERSDIWSYGSVLFFILKKRPINLDKLKRDVAKAKGRELDQHKHLVARVLMRTHAALVRGTPPIVDLICRATRLDPVQRTGSADALLRDVDLCAGPTSKTNRNLAERARSLLNRFETRDENSIMSHIANSVLADAFRTVQSASEGFATITGDHNELVHQMCRFLNQLGVGDEYLTLSFPQFWNETNMGLRGRYLTMNRSAAMRGVTIRRVFLVNNEQLADSNSHTQAVLRAHYGESMQCLRVDTGRSEPLNLAKGKNLQGWQTVVHYVDESAHQKMLVDSYNFALWRRGNESLGIFPRYVGETMVSIRLAVQEDPTALLTRFWDCFNNSTSLLDLHLL